MLEYITLRLECKGCMHHWSYHDMDIRVNEIHTSQQTNVQQKESLE